MLLNEIFQSDLRGRHPIEARTGLSQMVARFPIVAEVTFGYMDERTEGRPYGTYWYIAESVQEILDAVGADQQTLQDELEQDAKMDIEGGVHDRTRVRPLELVRLYVNGTFIPRYDRWFRQLQGQLGIV